MSKLPPESREHSVRAGELKALRKTPEEYVAIENQLAVQREKPQATPQLNSIFDQLRSQLPKQ